MTQDHSSSQGSRSGDQVSPPERLVPDWIAACLSCDPFEGDFGGGGQNDGVLRDQVVKAKVDSECHTCAAPVPRRSWARVRVEVYDGEFMRFRWCEKCCIAMSDGENPEGYEDRIALGIAARTGTTGAA